MPRPETSSTNNASSEVEALRQQIESLTLENEHLKLLVAKYRRMHFGQKAESQEQLGQLDLALAYDPLAIQVAESVKRSPVANDVAVEKRSSKRKPFPETLPRETVKYMPQATCCPDCGGLFKPLGEDVSEMLEYVPASFKVVRHVRPKLACVQCDHIAQADAPPRPIPRGMAGPVLLAHMPGKGRTKTARLWTYVRDDRPAGSDDPPAVWFAYSEDRKGRHPREHLKSFQGVLQADAYAGFDALV